MINQSNNIDYGVYYQRLDLMLFE